MELEESSYSCNFLKEPLTINDLLSRGSTFELNTNFNDELENEMYEELNLDNDLDDKHFINNETMLSPWCKSFKELRQDMEVINEYIYKRIIKEGDRSSGLIPNKARVHMRYNAYWEFQTTPFDSSYLRGNEFSFFTGCKQVLEGLEAAVKTMYCGEEAHFLISYHLLFHELGCPPRIQPRADGLFVIKLESFDLVGDFKADEQLNENELKNFSFVIEKVKDIHLNGLDLFKQRKYRKACRAFEKCINTLKYCHLANEEEQKENVEFLLKLYTNLAVLYNKLNQPNKVCVICQEIRRLAKDNISCKALFQEGRALSLLGDYHRAKLVLQKSHLMEPQNEEINQEIKLLQQRYTKYKENEKTIWTKALGIVKEKTDTKDENTEQNVDEFESEMIELLEDFKKNLTISTFKLPNLTDDEIQVVGKVAKRYELRLQKNLHDKNCYVLTRH